MPKLLSMPVRLRTDSVERLITAKMSGNIDAFCDAYDRTFRHPSKNAIDLLRAARQGDASAIEALWVKFLDQATAMELGPITDPVVESLLADARSDEFEGKEAPKRLYDYLQGMLREYEVTKLLRERGSADDDERSRS